jgi:molybdopterin-containing oxidoreductase family iron-sulfur binding subunit
VVDDTGYAKGRIPKNGKMSRHFQLESNMTLSGLLLTNAFAVSTTVQKQALVHIYNVVTGSVAVSFRC